MCVSGAGCRDDSPPPFLLWGDGGFEKKGGIGVNVAWHECEGGEAIV